MAKNEADSARERAKGEADAIREIAMARRKQAEELEDDIAANLEMIRVAGEAGHRIFNSEGASFVYAKQPGDVLMSMIKPMMDRK
jgi:hypothetical protein